MKAATGKRGDLVRRSRAFANGNASLRISAAEFRAWQARLTLSNADAARRLFISVNLLPRLRSEGGGPAIALACRAVLAGIEPADDMETCEKLGRIHAVLKGA